MNSVFLLIILTSLIAIFSISITIANPIFAQIDKTNWITDTVTLQYPPGWQLTLPTSKFVVNDFQLKEPTTNTLIQGSSGTIKSEYTGESRIILQFLC